MLAGQVAPAGWRLDFQEVPVLTQAFRSMVRELAYDVCEMSFTTYLAAKAYGKRFTALPVFLMRDFHHRAIKVNADAGIRQPKDLEGRMVGVNRGYTVTTGVWARGILATEYGVDLDAVTWVISDDEHVAEYTPPDNVIRIRTAAISRRWWPAASSPLLSEWTSTTRRWSISFPVPRMPVSRRCALAGTIR